MPSLLRRAAARLASRLRRRNHPVGQALVELAMIAPIVCLLLLGALDLGRVWQSQITINNAAREGAMEAMFRPGSYQSGAACNTSTNRVMCRILSEVRDSEVTVVPADVTVTCTPGCTPGTAASPSKVKVEVRGHFSLLTPLMSMFTGGQNLTLTGEAEATIAMMPTGGAVGTATPTPTPTPTPLPTPTPTPGGATPSPTPTPTPTPTPQPCVAPVANFTVSPTTGIKNKTTFVFTDTSTGMSNPNCNPIWSWNFADGTGASSAQNPTHKFSSRGTYRVTLSVSNSMGSSQKWVDIVVTNN